MTLSLFLTSTLAVLVLLAGAWTVLARRSFVATVAFVSYGLLLALVWAQLGAVDVALTEAAIGSGLTGVVLLGASASLRRVDSSRLGSPGVALRAAAAVLSLLVTGALCVVVLTLPEPAPTLAPAAMAALPQLGVGNPVTGVLLGFRALDTLLEKVVLLLALVGVWSLTPEQYWGGRPGVSHAVHADGVLPFFAKVLPPVGLLLAVHLLWVGADAPGGAFQSATVLAAMWLLMIMAGLVEAPAISAPWLRWTLVAGPLAFVAVGAAGVAIADGFLSYPEPFAKALIVVAEIPMTISVAAALALLVAGTPERLDS